MPLHLRVGNRFIGPGRIEEVELGSDDKLRVRVVSGLSAGPKLYVVAGIHGDESLSVGIAEELSAGIDPRHLHGVLLVVPAAAEQAMAAGQRHHPDGGDVNRCFPGSHQGSTAQRLARLLFQEVVARSDFGIDLHAAPDGLVNLAHVRGDMSNPYVRRLCEAFGANVILDAAGPPRSLRRAATSFGVPTITFEAGGTGRGEKATLQEGVKGILGVMADLRMLGGEVPWRGAPLVVSGAQWIRAPKAGRLEVLVQPGAQLRAHDVIARIDGGETIAAPGSTLVLSANTSRAAEPGALVCQIATPREPTLTRNAHQ